MNLVCNFAANHKTVKLMKHIYRTTMTVLMTVLGIAASSAITLTPSEVSAKGKLTWDNIEKTRVSKVADKSTFEVQRTDVVKGAKTRAVPDIIVTPPAGEEKVYFKDAAGYFSNWGQGYSYEENDLAAQIRRNADGEIFIANFFCNAMSDTWLRGTVSEDGKKAVFTFPQTYAQADADIYVIANRIKINIDENGYAQYELCENNSVTFDLNEDGSIVMETMPEGEMVGLIYSDDESFSGYADRTQSYRPCDRKPVSLPEDVEAEQWAVIYGGSGHHMNVAFDGDRCFLGNLFESMPDTWLEGTVKDGKVTLAQDQYIGVWGVYFVWLKVGYVEFEPPYYYNYFLVDSTEPYEFNYDATARRMTACNPDWLLMPNLLEDGIYYLETVDNPVIEYQEMGPGVPADPFDLTWDTRFYEDYGDNDFYFYLPQITTEGKLMDPSHIYYNIYLDGEPFEFVDDEYPGLPSSPMTDVPYLLTIEDYRTIINNGVEHIVAFYIDGVETVGVQQVYDYDGVVNKSALVTISTESGVKSIQSEGNAMTVNEEYLDMTGIKVDKAAKGIFIRARHMSDGTVKYDKVAR